MAKTTKGRTKKHAMQRGDFGKPIDGYIAKQPAPFKAILKTLRGIVEEAAPDATAAIKWGQPMYHVNGHMAVALNRASKHASITFVAPAKTLSDPDGLLEGKSTGGRHLKLRSVEEIPRQKVKSWVRTAARYSRSRPPSKK